MLAIVSFIFGAVVVGVIVHDYVFERAHYDWKDWAINGGFLVGAVATMIEAVW